MTKMTQMHIEYLREMMEDENEFLASEAKKELAELKAELESKGIFVI